MKFFALSIFLTALTLAACSPEAQPEDTTPAPEKNLSPADLKAEKTPASDQMPDFQIKAAYVHGGPLVTQAGADPAALRLGQQLQAGVALATPKGADAELYVQTPDFSDGVVRVSENSWTVLERDTRPGYPQFRVAVYGGRLSFFIPPSVKNLISIWTPGGTLFSRGGMFNVTVTPMDQVLVASREGQVVLNGPLIGAAYPGRALALDRPGAWSYTVPPSNASNLGERWLAVMTDDLMPTLVDQTAERTQLLNFFAQNPSDICPYTEEQVTSLVVWAWQAVKLLSSSSDLPSATTLQTLWKQVSLVRSQNQGQVWPYETSHTAPGMLGFTP
jgi:hypothetical protein